MKKFRKVIVALLAMVMALGCLTAVASADSAPYEDGGKLYFVGAPTDWSFKEMTGKDGVYTYEVEFVKGANAYKFKTTDSWDKPGSEISPEGKGGSGTDFSYDAAEAGTYVVTVDTKKLTAGEDATHWNGASAVTVAPKTAAPGAGVSAPVVAAVIAVVSMVGIVVFTKRRTVAE